MVTGVGSEKAYGGRTSGLAIVGGTGMGMLKLGFGLSVMKEAVVIAGMVIPLHSLIGRVELGGM